jgi:hypothetical protein
MAQKSYHIFCIGIYYSISKQFRLQSNDFPVSEMEIMPSELLNVPHPSKYVIGLNKQSNNMKGSLIRCTNVCHMRCETAARGIRWEEKTPMNSLGSVNLRSISQNA